MHGVWWCGDCGWARHPTVFGRFWVGVSAAGRGPPLGGWLVAVTAADASPHHAWFIFGRGCPRLDVNLRLLTRARPGDHTAMPPRDKTVPPGRSHSLWPSPGVSIPGWGQRWSYLRLRDMEPTLVTRMRLRSPPSGLSLKLPVFLITGVPTWDTWDGLVHLG